MLGPDKDSDLLKKCLSVIQVVERNIYFSPASDINKVYALVVIGLYCIGTTKEKENNEVQQRKR